VKLSGSRSKSNGACKVIFYMKETIKERTIAGKTFISTRPAGRSDLLRKFFNAHGAELLEMPMIEIRKAHLSPKETDIVENSGNFDWIVFTSSNGVVNFFDHLKDIKGSNETGIDTRIAVIGENTGSWLSAYGHTAHYVSSGSTGEAFSEELRRLMAGKKASVLLPVGNLASGIIEERLRGTAEVCRINVYRTEMPSRIDYEILKIIGEDKYEMVIFTSGSGVNNFCRAAAGRIDLHSLRIACIGTTTAGALESKGIKPLVTATEMSSGGIAGAILDYYM